MPLRNRIPIEQRERIVHAFEDEAENYLLLADMLGVNRSTARGIVARYIRERPRDSRNNVLVDDEMSQCLENIINENCVLTLSQINGDLRQTVARNLEGINQSINQSGRASSAQKGRKECCFDFKLARPVPADRNRRDILQRRQEYGNWFMNHSIMRHCVFIDECGYNIWTARNHGRARQGERAYRQVYGQRGGNVTMALAVSPVNGLVFHSAYIRGMNAGRFNDFLVQTWQNLDSDEEVIFIYDGPPSPGPIPTWRFSRPTPHS